MRLEIKKRDARDILINLLYGIILNIFANSLNTVVGLLAIAVYSVWLLYKMEKRDIQVADFLVMIPAVLLIGTNYLLYLGIVLIVIYGIIGSKDTRKVFLSSEVIGFTIMVITGCLSSELNATDIKSAHLYMGVYLLLAVMVIGFVYFRRIIPCDSKRNIAIFAWTSLLFGAGYFMTHSVSELFNTAHIYIYYIGRRGVYSNTLAGLMAPFVLGAAIIVLESKQKISRIVSGISFILMILIILAIQSRGAYLGMLVALFWLLSKKKVKKIFLLIIGFVVGVIFVSLFVPNTLIYSLFGRFDVSHFANGDFSNGRWGAYQIAIDMFKRHPIIGCGFWQFDEFKIPYSDPHNFVLAYLGSTGVIGCTGFIIYLISIYKRIKFCYKIAAKPEDKVLSEIAMCTFITYFVHGLVEPSLTTSAPLSIFVILSNIVYYNVGATERYDEAIGESNS